jgi:membrane protease YdiL (CAAX protease family)
MKKAFKYSLVLSAVSILAYLISFPYLIPVSQIIIDKLIQTGTSITLSDYLLAAGINFVLNAFIFSFIGLLMVDTVGLKLNWIRALIERVDKPKFEKRYVYLAVGWGIVSALVITLLIRLVFEPLIPQINSINDQIAVNMSWWAGISSVFQGGVVEELFMRLGIMTMIIWLLSQIFARKRKLIPSWIYWIGTIASALFFGVGHLPIALSLFGDLTPPIVCYVLISNSLAGIGFGYLYWKKGLEYGMIAHITSDFMLHFALIPLL